MPYTGSGSSSFRRTTVDPVKRFPQKAGGIHQQGGRRQANQELLGRCAIDSLDFPPDVVKQLEQRVSRFPIRDLQMPKMDLIAGRDVPARGHDSRLEDFKSLELEVFQVITQFDHGAGGRRKLLIIHTN